jgi:hypothetical protein
VYELDPDAEPLPPPNPPKLPVKYTKDMRVVLLESLKRRFSELVKDDLFVYATYLDPQLGNSYFSGSKQRRIKFGLIELMKLNKKSADVEVYKFEKF